MKYVVFSNRLMEIPVLIPDCANHCDVSLGTDFKAISAGFYSVTGGSVKVFMEQQSTSTGLKPRKNDSLLIAALIADASSMYFIKLSTYEQTR